MTDPQSLVRRLASEADAHADQATQSPGEFHPDWHAVRDAKFAELVARECEGQVMQAAKENPVMGASACYGAAAAIRQRFGVGE